MAGFARRGSRTSAMLSRRRMNALARKSGGHKKRRADLRPPGVRTAEPPDLGRLHLVGLQALRALDHHEANLLAFLQRLEAGALDGAEVHEEVFTAFTADEAKALRIVEPLHGTRLTIRHLTT